MHSKGFVLPNQTRQEGKRKPTLVRVRWVFIVSTYEKFSVLVQTNDYIMPEKTETAREIFKKVLVCLAGLEPTTFGLEIRCSIQLSYRHL